MMKKRIFMAIAGVAVAAAALTGCTSQANTVSSNLSKEADSFQVYRDITFYNGITDKYILEIQGLCSVTQSSKQVAVTCKTGPNAYKKDFMALSDNVTYVVNQIGSKDVSAYRYEVIFKPQELLPNVQTQTGK